MFPSTFQLEYGRHLARLRRRAYAPTSNTASHDNHENFHSRVSFSFQYGYGAPLGGPLGRQSSAITGLLTHNNLTQFTLLPAQLKSRKAIAVSLTTTINKLITLPRCVVEKVSGKISSTRSNFWLKLANNISWKMKTKKLVQSNLDYPDSSGPW